MKQRDKLENFFREEQIAEIKHVLENSATI